MKLTFSHYLDHEWVRTLGCTEPGSIAYAASTAAANLKNKVDLVKVVVDPRIFKNCFAVGIPNSGHKTGIKWAIALGTCIADPSMGLECFHLITPQIIEQAQKLIKDDKVFVDVDTTKEDLSIIATVHGGGGEASAEIAHDHTNIVRTEKDGKVLTLKQKDKVSDKSRIRKEVASFSITELIKLAQSITDEDRKRLREGIVLNTKMAEHGLTLFPKRFVDISKMDQQTAISKLVCAGVYARMSGEDFPVMSLAGSGNKGIVTSVPLAVLGEKRNVSQDAAHKALALSCLLTSAITHHLGSLSAVCGCSNAAGIGLAAGLVLLHGGAEKEIALAINNMVGNVTGMICDGAKIGCALKTMTSVDSAFRSASLAMDGLGIPYSDGIVGQNASDSLLNLGKIATKGMVSADAEILAIMQGKL